MTFESPFPVDSIESAYACYICISTPQGLSDLVLNLIGFPEGLCSEHADSTAPRVRQPGFHISSLPALWASIFLKMKSSTSMSTSLF